MSDQLAEDAKALSYLKRVMVDLHETRGRLQEAEGRFTEPIAIVGMSCRFPGNVQSPEDLWELVAAGSDGISGFPLDRGWDLELLSDPDSTYTKEGGFISGVGDFDAEFFGVTEREACLMDPQQRLLLETSWEAFEHAGIDPSTLKESDTGVFVGTTTQTYASLVLNIPESVEGYISTGLAGSMVSGRVAHVLGLEGPVVSVDAACASSALALHMAAQALRARECSMALAGGVTILATPRLQLQFGKQRLFALSPDARCKSFADAADGAGLAEGVGLVLVERLSDAQRRGHEVLAVMRSSAVNHDGPSNGLTAPNGLSHERVISDALNKAGVSPDQVDAVEGHGLGTVLGDSIEAQALLSAYGRDRDSSRPLWLGSVKSNIGHTLAASGVAGVMKMVMAMRNGLLPKTLHVDKPTRHVDWSSDAMALLMEPVPWQTQGDRGRRAGIHSFGMSGTNVHIILEESTMDPEEPIEQAAAETGVAIEIGPTIPWIVSGKDRARMQHQARNLGQFLAASEDFDPVEVGYSLATSRSQMSYRAVVVGRETQQLTTRLDDIANESAQPVDSEDRIEGEILASRVHPTFIFADPREQWIKRALSLPHWSPPFAAAIRHCDEAFWSIFDRPCLDALHNKSGGPSATSLELPEVFSLQVALAALWRASGVEPSGVVGYAAGEIAAAHVAGALSLEDAVRIVGQTVHADKSPDTLPSHEIRPAKIPLFSVTGERVSKLNPYCLNGKGQRNPDLSPLVETILTTGPSAFIEINMTPILTGPLRQCIDTLKQGATSIVVESIKPCDQGRQSFLAALGRLWVAGVPVDWEKVFANTNRRRIRLPTYAFNRRRYWVDDF